MKSRRSTKRASLAASLVAVLLVLWLVYYDQKNTSPGDIASAHAQDPRLLQPGGCTACHDRASQSKTSPCLACHDDVASQLSSQTGVHGRAPAEIRSDCSKCHSEHHGRSFRLVSDRSFILAGIPDPKRFDHAGLDFRLAGRHLRLACNQCHPRAEIEVLPRGESRFLGLAQRCTSCHQDVHEGRYGEDCASCHGQEEPFARAARFTHTPAFPLVGAHGHSACSQCHPEGTGYSVEALSATTRQEGDPPQPIRACPDCHPSPHNASFLARVSRQMQRTPGRSCEHCHQATRATFLGSDAAMSRQLHAATGFPLDPPHDQGSCAQCHVGFGESKASGRRFDVAYPGRGPDRCEVCHADPHRRQFEDGPFRGKGCLACHDRCVFQPSTFTVEQHEATRSPLTGAHRGVACNDCHMLIDMPTAAGNVSDKLRIFAGTPVSCEACHADVHDGIFDRPGMPQVVDGFQGCARCHVTGRFDRLRGEFDHAGWTGYALQGAHARPSCQDCHPHDRGHQPYGTTFGKAAGTRCDACHPDPHAGQFRALPGVDCSRCHSVRESFRDLVFNHQTQSRFPLDEDHVRVPCSTCHRSYRLPGGGMVVRYKPLGIVCGDCHIPPNSSRRPERNRP